MISQNLTIAVKYQDTINILLNALEARDVYTQGHSKRVAEISKAIATSLRFTPAQIQVLTMAALMHDIGKIGVSDSILNKTSRHTNKESEAIQQHPLIGYKILKDIKQMKKILHIVKHHHERYDGQGYPDQTREDAIPLEVYIVQLADSIDAMTTDRPYRKALSHEALTQEILQGSGTQFHPKVVHAYFKSIDINQDPV